jgi:hypothetical protein
MRVVSTFLKASIGAIAFLRYLFYLRHTSFLTICRGLLPEENFDRGEYMLRVLAPHSDDKFSVVNTQRFYRICVIASFSRVAVFYVEIPLQSNQLEH